TVMIESTATNFAGQCGGSYLVVRTWRATDQCTNSAACSQTVTVLGHTNVTLICVSDKTVEAGSLWTFDSPTVVGDSCGGANVMVMIESTATNINGQCGGGYVAVRTWRAIDECTNSTTCDQMVTVLDRTSPILLYPMLGSDVFRFAFSNASG